MVSTGFARVFLWFYVFLDGLFGSNGLPLGTFKGPTWVFAYRARSLEEPQENNQRDNK